jgi:hypothetical protein
LELVEGVSGGTDRSKDTGVGIGAGARLGQDLFKSEGFEALNAQQATACLNHLVNEEGLVFAIGLELVAQAGGEFVEVFGILVREDIEDSCETMAGRVTARNLFSFRRFRAGGVPGILPVCEDLGCGTHLFSLLSF